MNHRFRFRARASHGAWVVSIALALRLLQQFASRLLGTRRPHVRFHYTLDVAPIQRAMLALIEECRHDEADQIRASVRRAMHPNALWLMRVELAQLLGDQTNEIEALRRIATLTPLFSGKIDAGYTRYQRLHERMYPFEAARHESGKGIL